MSTLVYRINFRPVRVGFCVVAGDFPSLIKAFRLSHCLWGGRFNPIIVVDDAAAARRLVDLFRVDVLIPLGADRRCDAFSRSVKHLPWPTFHGELFAKSYNGKESTLLDIYHPVRQLFEANAKHQRSRDVVALPQWTDDDPLACVWEAMFGRYPAIEEVGKDYLSFVTENTPAQQMPVTASGNLQGSLVDAIVPNTLTALELDAELSASYYGPGLFVGSSSSFSDVVNFWNLRAANVDALFYDPSHEECFNPIAQKLDDLVFSTRSRLNFSPQRLTLWHSSGLPEKFPEKFRASLQICRIEERTWSRDFKVPHMYFGEHSSIGQVSEGARRPSVTLSIGDKPGFDERPFNRQHLVFSLRLTLDFSDGAQFLFAVPWVAELNEFFGREHLLHWDDARAEGESLGVIGRLYDEEITLFGIERRKFYKALFEAFGISAEVSQPGLVCEQLVRQMGGLQGCRVFKIRGVRALINKFNPTATFNRTEAVKVIGNRDEITGRPRFNDYEDLYIEPREKDHLKPEDVFDYLLRKDVFRVGLRLKCPICNLEFWRALDEIKSTLPCDYCGKAFLITPQLRDRDWAYRPSGLFGRGDRQDGGLPVSLTLQQLERVLHGHALWFPSMLLEPIGAPIEKCETDFVLLHKYRDRKIELVIGECKASGEISDEDVRNLAKVADALPRDRFDVFIVFSKTATFTPEEVERCRKANTPERARTILFSERELEPYSPYERAEKEFHIHRSGVSLRDLVEATDAIYFHPQPKAGATP